MNADVLSDPIGEPYAAINPGLRPDSAPLRRSEVEAIADGAGGGNGQVIVSYTTVPHQH